MNIKYTFQNIVNKGDPILKLKLIRDYVVTETNKKIHFYLHSHKHFGL